MKISKTPKKHPIKSCDNIPNGATIDQFSTSDQFTCCPYTQAKEFIQSAINSLANVANENPIAKDSIANLAVVLLDLQSC